MVPVSPGVTRAVLKFTYQGQECANILHFKQAGAGAAPDPAALGSRLSNWWGATGKNRSTLAVNLDQIICTDLSENGAPGFITTPPQPANGSATPSAPNNVTMVMSLHTALRGRSFRGRIYHVGIAQSNLSGNTIIEAYRASLIAGYTPLVVLTGGVGTPDFVLGVLSTFHLGAPRAEGLFTPVTTISCDGVVDSQRRRLPGRGS